MSDNRMVHRPLYLRILKSDGAEHVEERQAWGEDGPEKLHRQIQKSYADEWVKGNREGMPPAVWIITKAEYDKARFGKRSRS